MGSFRGLYRLSYVYATGTGLYPRFKRFRQAVRDKGKKQWSSCESRCCESESG